MSDAEKASLRNDLSVINADRANVNFAVPGPYTNDADAYANGVDYGEMYRKPDGSLSWNLGDPDAQLYIAAVEVALGTTIELALPAATNPRKIISDFYKAEKDAGRYSLHKRIYLPIYDNLAANAVDAITTTSGTFPISGAVTVAPGYVQGNGTTGYFDSGASLGGVGGSNASGSIWFITPLRVNEINRYEGSNGALTQRASVGTSLSNLSQHLLPSSTNFAGSGVSVGGITIGSTVSSSSRFVKNLSGSTFLTGTNTNTDTTEIPTVNMYFLARNNNNIGLTAPHTEQRGGYGFGLGLTEAQAEGYALNLKSLYESLTGLTLP
jgi:hypothetical protein